MAGKLKMMAAWKSEETIITPRRDWQREQPMTHVILCLDHLFYLEVGVRIEMLGVGGL